MYVVKKNLFISDLPYFVLLIATILNYLKKDRLFAFKWLVAKPFLFTLLIWAVLSTVSGYLNNTGAVPIINSFKWIFFTLACYFVVLNTFTYQDKRRLFKALLLVGFLQTPVTLFQRIFYVIVWKWGSADLVAGTFPVYYELAMFQVSCAAIFLAYKVKGQPIYKNTFLPLFLLIFPLVMANSKASWLFLLIIVGYMLFNSGISYRTMAKYATILFVFVVGGIIMFNSLYSNETLSNYSYKYSNFDYIINPQYIVAYQLGMKSLDVIEGLSEKRVYNRTMGRIGTALYNYFLISESRRTLFFGLGPPKYERERYIENKKIEGLYIWGGPMISRNLGHMGIIGLLLLLLLLGSLYFLPRHYLSEASSDRLIFKTIVFYLALLSLYFGVFYSKPTSIVLAIMSLPRAAKKYEQPRLTQ